MSRESCWKCGVLGHHRRDCDSDVDPGSAAQIKLQAVRDHRHGKPKSFREQTKWSDKQSIRLSDTPSIGLLKPHVEICLQEIYDFENSLLDIEDPSADTIQTELEKLKSLWKVLITKMTTMRDVVTCSKQYLKVFPVPSDEEDVIFRARFCELDQKRHPLLQAFSQKIARFEEFNRRIPYFTSLITSTELELEKIRGALGERSPSSAVMEALVLKMTNIRVLLAECKTQNKIMIALSSKYNEDKISYLEDQFENLWKLRIAKEREAVENLRVLSNCTICLEREKQVALVCGHQLCFRCLDSIRNSKNECPMCRGVLKVAVRLFSA